MKIQAVRFPSPWCVCGHLSEDHNPECVGIGFDCTCETFTPNEQDDEGYWFTDEQGRKLEGGP